MAGRLRGIPSLARAIPLPSLLRAARLGAGQTLPDGLYAEIKTERGTIVCSLEYQKVPMTVSNFVGLAEGTLKANGAAGRKFYDGLTFHRVDAGFRDPGRRPQGRRQRRARATSFPTRRGRT